jgi:hypothetical protein
LRTLCTAGRSNGIFSNLIDDEGEIVDAEPRGVESFPITCGISVGRW